MRVVWSFLLLAAVVSGVVDAGLALHRRVQCGDHACSENEYCNEFGNMCSPCGDVCDFSSHNYNHKVCYENCQAFIHDQQFVSKSESVRLTSSLKDLTMEVKKLQLLAWLSMTFSGVAAACLFFIGFCKLSKAKRRHGGLVPLLRTKFRSEKKAEKQKAVDQTGLKLAIHATPPPGVDTTAPPTCSTTMSGTLTGGSDQTPPSLKYKQRCASEDNTLDYTYDNAGMTPSPTNFAKGVEFNTKGELRF